MSFPRLLGSGDPALVTTAIHHYRERFATVGLFENALYDGIPEALRDLRAEGFRTYVATSKPRVFALRIVEHFGLAPLFDAVHGSELDGTRSDKGELIGHLMQVEGLPVDRTLMVGDREHDMVGGARNGLRCIGVTYGYGSAEELMQHGAASIVDGPQELVAAVERLFLT